MTPKDLKKRKAASVAAKPKTTPKKKTISTDEKRVEAAKEAARRFIAGIRTTPRKTKKAPVKKAERPAAARPAAKTVSARPAAPKPAAKAAPPSPPKPAAKAAPSAPPPKAVKAKAPVKPAKAAVKKPAPRKSAEPEKAVPEPIRQAAEEGKFYLGAEQRVMPPVEAIDIPKGYNVDRIVAMVRDPHWLFAYWEVTDRKYRELERAFGHVWAACKMILRVYDRSRREAGPLRHRPHARGEKLVYQRLRPGTLPGRDRGALPRRPVRARRHIERRRDAGRPA